MPVLAFLCAQVLVCLVCMSPPRALFFLLCNSAAGVKCPSGCAFALKSPASSAEIYIAFRFCHQQTVHATLAPSTSRILPLEVLTVKSEDTCNGCLGARPPAWRSVSGRNPSCPAPCSAIHRAFWLQKPVASVVWHVASGALSLLSFDPSEYGIPFSTGPLRPPPPSLHLPGFSLAATCSSHGSTEVCFLGSTPTVQRRSGLPMPLRPWTDSTQAVHSFLVIYV